jgi:Ca-activated chloride channel family protein
MKRAPAIPVSAALALIIGMLFSTVPGQAQKQPPPSNPARPAANDDPQRIGVLEVRLPLSVKKRNKFIGGLTVNNFEVYEDGKRQNIINFMSPSDLPLNIALMIDTSNSVKLKLPFLKDAGEDFVSTVTTRRRKDKVLVASFDSDVELHQDFTDNQQLLISALRKLKASGVTRLYDGAFRVIEEKMATLTGTDSRRVMVILSDGADTASEHTLRQAIEMAQKYDVTVFGISSKNFSGTGSGQVEGEDDKDLRQLCEETGGQILLPSQKAELFRSFSEIAYDLRSEYVLFYKPINQERSPKDRQIRVKLLGADGELWHKRAYKY